MIRIFYPCGVSFAQQVFPIAVCQGDVGQNQVWPYAVGFRAERDQRVTFGSTPITALQTIASGHNAWPKRGGVFVPTFPRRAYQTFIWREGR
jgi:hypothetical protein